MNIIESVFLPVSPREFDTILFALRFWQSNMDDVLEEGDVSIEDPLTEDEINDLCERINIA